MDVYINLKLKEDKLVPKLFVVSLSYNLKKKCLVSHDNRDLHVTKPTYFTDSHLPKPFFFCAHNLFYYISVTYDFKIGVFCFWCIFLILKFTGSYDTQVTVKACKSLFLISSV